MGWLCLVPDGALASAREGKLLLEAVRGGSLERCEQLLAERPKLSYHCKHEGFTALHVASAAGRPDVLAAVLRALRAAMAPLPERARARRFATALNAKNVLGQTPLMLACKAGCAACVRALLAEGADATRFDSESIQTALHYAANFGHACVIDVLLGDGVEVPQARGSWRLRDAPIVDSQGSHKYIDGRAAFGVAALHLACWRGHLSAVCSLLAHGAALAPRCNTDTLFAGGQGSWTPYCTPLHLAAASGSQPAALALLQAWWRGRSGPDLRTLTDIRGDRPADVALANGHRALARVLHPGTPLDRVLAVAVAPSALPGADSLAHIAARAHRRMLAAQLAALALLGPRGAEAEEPRQRGRRRPGSARSSAAGSLAGSLRAGGAALRLLGGLAGGRPCGDACCPVCLDAAPDARIQPCAHGLCAACAGTLCEHGTARPLLCPLCRGHVAGFVAAGAAG